MLRKHLRLSRQEKQWVGLHQLSAFTQTDLVQDPVLRPLLATCGCGHLLALADSSPLADSDHAPAPKALAADLRRYLRMAA